MTSYLKKITSQPRPPLQGGACGTLAGQESINSNITISLAFYDHLWYYVEKTH
jgi:hypothetical protein